MTKPVNILALRYEPNTTLERGWKIYVDQESLLELLEQSVKSPAAQHWTEKNDARIDLTQLAESIEKPGEFSILICAHCAAAGYPNCGDLLLHEFRIMHEGQFISWEIDPPGHGFFFDDSEPLRFKFHRPQYTAAVYKVTNSDMR